MRLFYAETCVRCGAGVRVTTEAGALVARCVVCETAQPQRTDERRCICGRVFTPRRPWAKYCRPAHRWLAWKRRHRSPANASRPTVRATA